MSDTLNMTQTRLILFTHVVVRVVKTCLVIVSGLFVININFMIYNRISLGLHKFVGNSELKTIFFVSV